MIDAHAMTPADLERIEKAEKLEPHQYDECQKLADECDSDEAYEKLDKLASKLYNEDNRPFRCDWIFLPLRPENF